MQSLLAVFGGLVLGVLQGFDRLVFRGHLRQLSYAHGMECYLSANRVLLKDFTGQYDIVVLDEITYLVNFGFVSVEDLLKLIRSRPPHLHLILTGRNTHPALIEATDLVTEMREVKHPHHQGVKMQRGIEF